MFATPREGKALVLATRPFAREVGSRSRAEVASTFALLAAGFAATLGPTPLALKALIAPVVGLLVVRAFVLFHDHQHKSLLHDSRIARAWFYLVGLFVLTPPRVWRDTHDYHHAHTAKLIGSHIGSYPTVSVGIWAKLSPADRRRYAIARHPLTVLAAYVTIFLFGMCVQPLLRNPRRYAGESLLALGLHFSLIALIGGLLGSGTLVFGFLLPMNVAFVVGAYLFYAQHNFEDVFLADRSDWDATRAALRSSSYLELGPIMRWFTANIGYHHIHHLNARIPFYRLPEAMEQLPELQDVGVTRLRPREIAASFRLKLWDPDAGRMVGFPRAQR
ncbi:MAG: fatty acid desaturase [Polyangiaceae bacterium]|nr:fatty acid desaturase [Polyangiaceae bacterium]